MKQSSLTCLAGLCILALLAGCGGSTDQSRTSPGSTRLAFTAGDAASDLVLSLELTVSSVVLNTSSGSQFAVLPAPTRIEISHLSATAEPLSILDVPQDTYTSVTVVLRDAELVFLNPLDGSVVGPVSFAGPFTLTVNFNPALTVGDTPLSVNFDIDLASSVTINGATASLTPAVLVSTAAVPANPDDENEQSGELEDITGRVASTAAGSFVLDVATIAQDLTVAVNTDTVFEGVADASGLVAGMIVEVDAIIQTNGQLLATKVEAEIEDGGNVAAEAEGLVLGAGEGQIAIVVQESTAAASPPEVGSTLTVDVDEGTTFVLPEDKIELGGLPFTPSFASLTDVAPGQRLATGTNSTFADPADKVELELQTIAGTVGVQDGNQFVLVPPADSAFVLLSFQSELDVFVQPSTELSGLTSVVTGTAVRVRGLLFFDSDSGRYKLVATRIAAP